jgi:hypothetical protein
LINQLRLSFTFSCGLIITYCCLPLQGTRGKVYPLPAFARSQSAAAAGSDGGAAPPAADEGSFLVVWDVEAESGVGPVLLLARAAHCLRQLHVANVGRQAVADSEYWQVGARCDAVRCLLGSSAIWSMPSEHSDCSACSATAILYLLPCLLLSLQPCRTCASSWSCWQRCSSQNRCWPYNIVQPFFLSLYSLQDLRLILKLLAALLQSEPMLAKYLMTVRIDYAASQKMDWLDVIIASLNVLPSLAATASAAAAAAPGQLAGNGNSNFSARFGQQVLAALADCLQAASAAAGVQPGRVLSALGSCQLFAGAALAAEPLPLVPLESLAGWVQRQQQAELGMEAVEDWRTLETLQVGSMLIAKPNAVS